MRINKQKINIQKNKTEIFNFLDLTKIDECMKRLKGDVKDQELKSIVLDLAKIMKENFNLINDYFNEFKKLLDDIKYHLHKFKNQLDNMEDHLDNIEDLFDKSKDKPKSEKKIDESIIN